VGDARALHAEYVERGARIRHPPTNYAWALEMQVEDLDGNVLRMGSEPDEGAAIGEWLDMRGDRWVRSRGGWTRLDRGRDRASDALSRRGAPAQERRSGRGAADLRPLRAGPPRERGLPRGSRDPARGARRAPRRRRHEAGADPGRPNVRPRERDGAGHPG